MDTDWTPVEAAASPAAPPPMPLSDDWHTVPAFDHRQKTKYKPGDLVQTPFGPAKVINTAPSPIGNVYRVETQPSGKVIDFHEEELGDKADGMVFGSLNDHFLRRLASVQRAGGSTTATS